MVYHMKGEVIYAFLLAFLMQANASSPPSIVYEDVHPVNKSDSVYRIANAPLRSYSNKYDSVQGRTHIGVLGADAQRWFPEAVDTVPRYTVPNRDRTQPPIIIENFPVVDKNIIFTHGVIALQEMVAKYDDLSRRVGNLKVEHDAGAHIRMFKELERRLEAEGEEQLKEKALLLEAELELKKAELETAKTRVDVDRALVERELDDERSLFAHQEERARRRIAREEEMERLRLDGALKLEKDLADSREKLRTQSAAQLQERRLELENDLAEKKARLERDKVRAEAAAKAEQERLNEGMNLRKMEAQAAMDKERLIKGVETIFQQLSQAANGAVARPWELLWVCGLAVALIGAYFVTKEAANALRETLLTWLGKPKLLRETSVQWDILPRFITDAWVDLWGAEAYETGLAYIEKHFHGVVLSKRDNQRVLEVALTTRNSKASGSAYRHLLLHGPPGTGKTLVARRLADCSGMDLAIMSGGDVGPLGEDAVPQLHHLFRWASQSRKGLLIFIDECEAFLGKRTGTTRGGSDGQRHALNALLYQTGTESYSFMLVLATNRPEDLDPAVLDRMDVSVRIGLPELEQRSLMCALYFQKNVLDMLDRSYSTLAWLLRRRRPSECVDEMCTSPSYHTKVARRLDGFSGREIAKLMTAVRYSVSPAAVQAGTVFGAHDFDRVVELKLEEHQEKRAYERD